MLGALERFGGYTLETLMAESTELLRLLAIEQSGVRADGQ